MWPVTARKRKAALFVAFSWRKSQKRKQLVKLQRRESKVPLYVSQNEHPVYLCWMCAVGALSPLRLRLRAERWSLLLYHASAVESKNWPCQRVQKNRFAQPPKRSDPERQLCKINIMFFAYNTFGLNPCWLRLIRVFSLNSLVYVSVDLFSDPLSASDHSHPASWEVQEIPAQQRFISLWFYWSLHKSICKVE